MYQYHQERPTPSLLFDIAKGNMWDSEAVNIFGFNRTVGIDWETVWNDGDDYVYPASAVQMSLVSASVSDTMQVLISGLDADYNKLVETVTLTGTSAVTTTQSFFALTALSF